MGLGIAIMMLLIDVYVKLRLGVEQPFPAGIGDVAVIQVEGFQMRHLRQNLQSVVRSIPTPIKWIPRSDRMFASSRLTSLPS